MEFLKITKIIFPLKLRQWIKRYYLLRTKEVHLRKSARVWNTEFEGKNFIYDEVHLRNSYIGMGTYISAESSIVGSHIGRFCSIGKQVIIGPGDHPTDFISTHPSFYSPTKQAGFTFSYDHKFDEYPLIKDSSFQVFIGHDVWIGNRAVIKNGVHIGHGAIVGAGAIVTQNLDPFGIYLGVPARLNRYRFDDETRTALLKSAWWDKDWGWLQNHAHLFLDHSRFFQEIL